jgi:hypothetical protein
MRTVISALTTLAVLGCLGCGGQSFAQDDPKGYEACSKWAGYKSRGDAASIVGGGLAVAEIARESKSKNIRAAVSNLFDEDAAEITGQQFGLLDAEKFEAACEDQGFEF